MSEYMMRVIGDYKRRLSQSVSGVRAACWDEHRAGRAPRRVESSRAVWNNWTPRVLSHAHLSPDHFCRRDRRRCWSSKHFFPIQRPGYRLRYCTRPNVQNLMSSFETRSLPLNIG